MFVAGVASAETCSILDGPGACAECVGDQADVYQACQLKETTDKACPAGVQAKIDAIYLKCDGKSFAEAPMLGTGTTWDAIKPDVKAYVVACGCGGAAQAAPLFAALAAIVNHFLN